MKQQMLSLELDSTPTESVFLAMLANDSGEAILRIARDQLIVLMAAISIPADELERLMLKVSHEDAFDALLLAYPGTKVSPRQAWDLFERALQGNASTARVRRLMGLLQSLEGKSWQCGVLELAWQFRRSDLAQLLSSYWTGESIPDLECARWFVRSRQDGNFIESRLGDSEKRRQYVAVLLNFACTGNARWLTHRFRQTGGLWKYVFGDPEAEVDTAGGLFKAAQRSGSQETEDAVFLYTSLTREEWLAAAPAHEAEKPESAPSSEQLALSQPPVWTPPISLPVTTRSEVKNFLNRCESFDKEVNTRIKQVVNAGFGSGKFDRELGRVVAPEALNELAESFPLFAPLIEEIRAQLNLLCRVEASTGEPQALKLPNVLIVGEPGWGKTYFINRLAELMGLPFHALTMSAVSAGFILCGSDPVWSTSRPGLIHDALVNGEKLNPIILLDEIDKIASDGRYPADGCLYPLLEPNQARCFKDEFANYTIDASHINWFASANNAEQAHPAILSRFDIFEVPKPTHEIALKTARSVYKECLSGSPWHMLFEAEPTDMVLEMLAKHSPRVAHRYLQKAFGRAGLAGRSKLEAGDFSDGVSGKRPIGFV